MELFKKPGFFRKLGVTPRVSKEKPGFLIQPDRASEKQGFFTKLGLTPRASKEKPGFFEKVRREAVSCQQDERRNFRRNSLVSRTLGRKASPSHQRVIIVKK
jgi:hypothetical protein